MAKYMVGTVDEIPPGERKIVDVAGRSVGIFNVGGEFYALRNTCPHQGGPLCQGRLTGFVMARVPGEYTYDRRGEILRCPWHGWEFDVKTGQSWFDPVQTRVRTYPVTVKPLEMAAKGDADVPPDQASDTTQDADAEGMQKGPYMAETYDVTLEKQVEKQAIIIDIP